MLTCLFFHEPRRLWTLLPVVVLLSLLAPSLAQAQIETEDDLRAAIELGGEVVFDSDVQIVLTSPIVISNSVTLDAAGNTVIIDGDDFVQIFSVDSGVTDVNFIGISLVNGTATNGGAVYIGPNASVTFTNCSFRHNQAAGENGTDGAAGANVSFGIGGNGSSGKSGKPAWGGAIYCAAGSDVSLFTCEFITNSATGGLGGNGGDGGDGPMQGGNGGNGGNGAAAYAGAIYLTSSTTLSATDCEFDGNFTVGGDAGTGGSSGAGAFAGRHGIGGAGAPSGGGAIYGQGEVSLTNCTFYANGSWGGNSTAGGEEQSEIGSDGKKGGNTAGGAVWSAGTNAMQNCTFCANVVRGGDGGNGGAGTLQGGSGGNGGDAIGAGICNSNTLFIWNCTIALNAAYGGTNGVAPSQGFTGSDGSPGATKGAGLATYRGALRLKGTLLSTNAPGTNIAKITGTFVDDGYNLSSDNATLLVSTNSLKGLDPKLGALSTNGGFTKTMPISKTSPAVDKMPKEQAPDTDQCGKMRPLGTTTTKLSDIGAFEFDPIGAPVIIDGPKNQILPQSSTVTFSVKADGARPFTYQWSFNGIDLAGATASVLTLLNIQPTQCGTYAVRVVNAGGMKAATASLFLAPVLVWGEGLVTNVPLNATNLISVSAGAYHMLALRQDGTVLAWGAGTNNSNAEPDFGQAMVPANLTNVTLIAAGDYHSLAKRRDGTMVAWGRNSFGEASVPASATNIQRIAAGANHSLALRQDLTVMAWGLNSAGQTDVPPGLHDVGSLAAGTNHSLALLTNGTVVAWGANSLGQISVPAGLSNVQAIAAGANHSLALRTNGQVVAWGDNSFGQTNLPSSLTNVVLIGAGANHCIAVRSDGFVVSWGDRSHGQTWVPRTLNVLEVEGGQYFSTAVVDPQSSAPPPIAVFSIVPAKSGGTYQLQFSSQIGVFYELQQNTNDLSVKGNWITIYATAGTGSLVAFPMPAVATANSFYRVRAR